MKGLETLQLAVARALMTLALLQIPVLIAVSVARSAHSGIVDVLVLMFGVVPLLVYLLDRPSRVVGEALAVSLIGQAAVLVFLLKGHPWQVEMHFYFFVVLAMLAGFCERSILVIAAALIAAHHLVLDSLVPAAIYPGGGNVIRLGLHAAFVVVETGMLVFFSHIIRASFIEAASAREKAEWSASELASAGSTLEEELSSTTAKALHLETTLNAFQIEVGDSLKRLAEASAALDSTADSFSKTVTHTTNQTATVSAAAGDANKKVGEVASAGRTYLASLSEVGVTSITSVQLGEAAVVEALNTVAAIDELITMSSQIDEAASLITALAMQTNLLALNATIEAGRAGVHGRGFAVVASEVKSLASEAARASTTITKTVAGIQTSTRRSAGAIGSILVAVRELKANAAMVSEAVEERVQLAATIASNADAAAKHVEHVSCGIDAIEIASIDNTKSADVLQGAASEVALQTEAIRERLRDFAADLGRLNGDTHRHLRRAAA